jgi:outer membrane protein assembly factor BamB/predicted small lipoprotein YifL
VDEREQFPVGWRRMKQILLMIAVVALVGCGKKEPVQPSASNPEATKPEKEMGKEATQPTTPNPETTKPETTKAKATAGVKLWEFETGGIVVSSPAIGSDGTVYVGSWDKKLYAINGKSGVKLWEFETGSAIGYSSPAIGSLSLDGIDTVYVGSRDNKPFIPMGTLYAINGKSGVKLWEFETGGGVYSSPAIGSDGTVYVGSLDTKLYAINGKSGVKLWEFETRGSVFSSPVIGSDGTVYIGSRDKKLYAINGKSGVKLWEFKTGGPVYSPTIGPDGTVYVGSDDKKLYAIKTDSKGLAKSPWPMRGQNPLHTGRAPTKE